MPTKYLFILGAQRSGSTLLNLVLGSHPAAIAIGEGWKLNQAVVENNECTCGQPIQECAFWKKVSVAMEQDIGWNPFVSPGQRVMHRRDVGKIRSILLIAAEKIVGKLGATKASNAMLSLIKKSSTSKSVVTTGFALLDACLVASGAKLAVDSGKDAFRVDAMFSQRPELCKIVFLVRDGRGVSASRLGKGRSPSTPNHPSMQSAARQWKKENLQTLAVVKRFPSEAWMIQRYEEFCESPKQVLSKICDFAGFEFDESMLQFGDQQHHNLIGNRMRFSKQANIRVDDAWRNNLTQQELAEFNEIAGELNKHFGFTE